MNNKQIKVSRKKKMEALNKNKEEIEKIGKGCNKVFLDFVCGEYNGLHLCSICKRAKQERISTSMLFCKDEIESINSYLEHCDGCGLCDTCEGMTKDKLKQLQTHLNWLKEQEKKQ